MRLLNALQAPPVFFLFVCLALGTVVGSRYAFNPDIAVQIFLCIFLIIFLLAACLRRRFFFVFGVLLFCIGFYNIQSVCFPEPGPDHISRHMPENKALIYGRVLDFGNHYAQKARYVVDCERIALKNGSLTQVHGKIILSVYGTGNPLNYGDYIRFTSAVKPLRNFENPGGFDYVRMMKLKGIWGTAYTPTRGLAKISDESSDTMIKRFVRSVGIWRYRINQFICNADISDVRAKKILATLVTGKKENLDSETRDFFSRAGISHILAISGLHVSIVGLIFFWLFYRIFSLFPNPTIRGVSKKSALALCSIPVLVYALFSGFSPSTQRAVIMVTAFFLCFVSEKQKDMLSSLSAAGILILIFAPASLFSISFQLSFAAVGFIILGFRATGPLLSKIDNRMIRRLLSMVLVTFFAGVGTMPLVAHYFHIISCVQLVTNIVAVPVIGGLVLPLGLAASALSAVLPGTAEFLLELCCAGINLVLHLSEWICAFDGSWLRVPSVSWTEIALFYAACLPVLQCGRLDIKKRRILYTAAGVLFLTVIAAHHIRTASAIEGNTDLLVTVLDVGQGNSAFIRTPDQKTILVDGGGFSGTSAFDTGRLIVAPFLWGQHIQTIDVIVLTHPENDHLKGLVYIFENFNVKTFIKNRDKRSTDDYRKIMDLCRAKNIDIRHPDESFRSFRVGDVFLRFYPPYQASGENLNNNSVVTRLVYENFSMLFAGDILKERELFLSDRFGEQLKSDILMAPHHGSTTSSSKIFLEKVNPGSIIVSCGWRNRYGFPDQRILKRYQDLGIRVLRTDTDGAVKIQSDGYHTIILKHKGV